MTANKTSQRSIIRAKNPKFQRLLQAAADGDLDTLRAAVAPAGDGSDDGLNTLRQAVCSSGCSALHWAAGTNQLHVVDFLLSPISTTPTASSTSHHQKRQQQVFDDVDLPAVKKSLGRTPLHYCCRNGHIVTAKWLVEHGADVRAKAKHGVTPFQMAVWQNRLEICRWLVESNGIVPVEEVNDFQCSPVHWIGICSIDRANFRRGSERYNACWYDDGRDLLPLASWLAEQPGIDFQCRQRQGHTALHKAAWGGHLALIKYLHTHHDMWDDVVDEAGNYSASLSDMANTPRHDIISKYLREECSRDRAESCKILGVCVSSNKAEIRKAYLDKARKFHPDRRHDGGSASLASVADKNDCCFDEIRRAYIHLTEHDGHGNQANPAHSLNLMLQANGVSKDAGEDSFFKVRLTAVLLEYGEKGIDLSNIRKKWKQVWPEEPFPADQTGPDDEVSKSTSLSSFLRQKAGDVIRLEPDGKSGGVRVFSLHCSQAKIAEAAAQAATQSLNS